MANLHASHSVTHMNPPEPDTLTLTPIGKDRMAVQLRSIGGGAVESTPVSPGQRGVNQFNEFIKGRKNGSIPGAR